VNIDQEIIFSVLDEALSSLPTISEAIRVSQSDCKLDQAVRDAQAIKGAASVLDEMGIYELAKKLELQLRGCNGQAIDDAMKQQFAAQIIELESLLTQKRAALSLIPADEVLTFSEEVAFVETVPAVEEQDFDVDPETMEIFAQEADDLLRNISEQLEKLSRSTEDGEALMEVRRSSHTLKGSAAIIGMKGLSALAHRMEDLLDLITERRLALSADDHRLLVDSTDRLASLAHGENSERLQTAIAELYARYECAMSLLQKQGTVVEDEIEISIAPDEHREEIAAPTVVTVNNSGSEERQPRTSVIRISIDRLDEMMRLFSEVLQSRATIEQRMSEMEKQVQELQHSTNRLRQASSKLEIDFEAGMMKNAALKTGTFSPAAALSSGTKVSEFDDLEFDRYTDFHQVTRQLVETGSDVASINIEMESLLTNLESVFAGQRHLIDEIQKRMLQFRMVTFDSLARRLQRTVHITAEQEEKLVDLEIEGGEMEIDTQILDSLIEPLLHILRNAVSHGIEAPDTRKLLGKRERGVIRLRLAQEGTFVVLSVTDDGRGIQVADLRNEALKDKFVTNAELDAMTEEEVLSLIFLPGLSTSMEVSEVSGRGVGMNIVKENLARYQGSVMVSSELQSGTTIMMRVPMALSAMHALLVRAGAENYAIPLDLVKKVIETSEVELAQAQQQNQLAIDGISYRLNFLTDLLGTPRSVSHNSQASILLMKGTENIALAVDELFPPQELVLKPLCYPLQNLPGLLGASILGNGKVVPVLDMAHLFKQTGRKQPVELKPRLRTAASIMIVDDSPSVRRIMSAIIGGAGWEVTAAKDGIEAFEMLQNDRELPKVILTDVEMPRMDGYELLATVKRHEAYKHIPVIIITSRAGEKHRRKALDLGVSEYVTKPYEDSALLNIIKRLAAS
jgi:chemosensory pili system protein ChpA (sensor histidine kinase/response regulator)